ncbi:hypothetical protein EMIHUDRAFT_122872, partial [Emiliania huxleyi CCMP1516]|uniref:Iron hydrogenase large subunit C-terminal domain-containing protein n=2 Tax=Emiliania huxleyi TaxID=2903 RepID=A0A0D3KCR0_EMIH1
VAELTLTLEGRHALRFVRAYGFRNIQNVVRRVKTGRCAYHFVELMACPAGCANGGGQPRPPPLEASGRAAAVEAALVAPGEAARRHPCDNPAVASLFREGAFLEGGPLGAAVASQLTTEFNALADEPPTEQSALGIQW